MRVGGIESEWFRIWIGLRQGCVMSPWFNMYTEGVVRDVKVRVMERGPILRKNGENQEWRLNQLPFANDIFGCQLRGEVE